jgi:PLP dependent protein
LFANLFTMAISGNIEQIREGIAEAARRAGRSTDEVELVAVSKTFPAECVMEAYAAGQRVFGENRVQEFAEKAERLLELRNAEFHLIGHLQSNKAAKAAELFQVIDSVDSLRLARKLNDAAAQLGRKLPILIEINVGGEEQKSGIAPASPELEQLLQAARSFDHVEVRGLMTVPPFSEDPEASRPYFRMLRDIRDGLAQRKLAAVGLEVLSMGMSNDYEVAIEEGSTQVRIGTAIFGKRKKT